jgi:hypothetical protein
MNTKDFLRLGVPLGWETRRAMNIVSMLFAGGVSCEADRQG